MSSIHTPTMTPTFQRRLKKIMQWLTAGFLLLFIFRIVYGYTSVNIPMQSGGGFFEDITFVKRNYASKEYRVKAGATAQQPAKMDQKYEKIAEIKTGSTNFDEEEKTSRKLIENFDALIQFEQKSGNKGYRKLNLVIGVPPENFDSLYANLIRIGEVQAKQITKKDKTNEYKELNAQKASLEKIRNSLIALKTKGGKIDEFMQLENRILEIEQQLQNLGVSLGDFDDENEFCTVQFSILEKRSVKISIMHRVKVALEWTIKFYLRLLMIAFFMSGFAYLVLLGLGKLNLLGGKEED